MSDQEPVEERWVYAGRRYSYSSEKVSYVWRDEKGDLKYFNKSSAGEHAVGGIYQVKITYKGDDTLTMHGNRTWTGDMADDAVGLKAQDEDAYRQLDARRREKRAGQLTELDSIVQDILDVVRNFDDIAPIVNSLSRRLHNEMYKRAKETRR